MLLKSFLYRSLLHFQAQNDLEEKEASITHLKNKLSMMEQRSSTQNLPQNEQVQALVNEVSAR